MLDPHDKSVFDGLISELRAGDPKFARRIDKLVHPRRRLRAAIAVTLWLMAPVCIIYGGWTGLIMAVVGAGYGAHLMARRNGLADGSDGFSWWSSQRRFPMEGGLR